MSGDRTADVARLAEALQRHGIIAVATDGPSRMSGGPAAVLLPVVEELADERARQAKADVWSLAASWVGPPFEQEFRDRAAALRGTP